MDEERFQRFYHGNKNQSSGAACEHIDVGALYRCPVPTIGGPITDDNLHHPQAHSRSGCGAPIGNMGKLVHCKNKKSKGNSWFQMGGGHHDKSNKGEHHAPRAEDMGGMTYTATGKLKKTKKCKVHGYGTKADHRDRNWAQCSYLQYNGERQYDRESNETPGYYLDLTAPAIGNRPVHAAHDNYDCLPNIVDSKLSNQINYPGRGFDCYQPFWNEKCV